MEVDDGEVENEEEGEKPKKKKKGWSSKQNKINDK